MVSFFLSFSKYRVSQRYFMEFDRVSRLARWSPIFILFFCVILMAFDCVLYRTLSLSLIFFLGLSGWSLFFSWQVGFARTVIDFTGFLLGFTLPTRVGRPPRPILQLFFFLGGGVTEFYRVLSSFSKFYLVVSNSTEYFIVVPSCTKFYPVLPSFTDPYSFTEFYRVLRTFYCFT